MYFPFSFLRPHVGASTALYLASNALALSASVVGAPPPPPDVSTPERLDPFIVQGRATDLVGTATSASQGIVGAAELGARPFLRRGELLEVIPGVVITQHSGGGKANQYFLRGFNLDHGSDFSVSVDGLPVNLRSHAHGQGYADLNFLIPELVRQVDYHKGPFFADVGDFSSAGAAEFRQFDRLPENFVSLTLGENAFARFVTGGTRSEGDQLTTAALELSRDDGPWIRPENFERVNAFLRHRWGSPGAGYRLTAMAYHATWQATDQIPLRAVEAGELDRFGTLDDTDGGSSARVSLSFDADWRHAEGTTRLTAYALHYRMNLYSNFTYFLDDPVNGDQFNQRDRRNVLGVSLDRTWVAAPRGEMQSETTAGLQLRADLIDELGLHRTAQRSRLSTVRDDRVDQWSAGVYARNETRWRDWLRTDAGLRVDAYRFDVASDLPRNSGRANDQIVSPKLGLALGPWAATELYLNAGFGFHSNDARGTTIRVDPADGVTPVDPVTPLVRSRGAEIGVRTAVIPGVVSTVSLWGLTLDSELVFVGDAGGTEPAARTRRHGLEFANFWRPTPWLALEADLTFTHARYRDDLGEGTRIANSITRVATGGVTFGRELGGFGSVRVRHFGPRPLTEDNAERAPASTTFNAQLGWRTEKWEIAVDVLNVLDRENYDIAYYYTSRRPGEGAEGLDDLHFHPAEPRTVRLTLTRRW